MNMQIKRIPVTILTGFLGSGKTTLLNRVLQEAHGKRIAVIENEFGEVSIDDALLQETTQPIMKVSNGCLCCTVNGDLVKTLEDLIKRRSEYDYVVIETTGVANPAPVVQTFLINEDINDAFEIDAVITLVDAKHLELHIESKECKEQIAFADVVILNKVDLVDSAEIAEVEDKIRVLNKHATIYKTERSALGLDSVLDQKAFSDLSSVTEEHECNHAVGGCEHDHDHDHAHDHDHNHAHDHDHANHLHVHNHDEDVQSVGFELAGSVDSGRFNKWFGELIRIDGDNLYRCKGILSVEGKTDRVIVQAVHRVTETTKGVAWGDDKRILKLVFIGKNLNRDALLTGLKNCLV
ncbi:MAG: GTP-binding protein [Leptolyngbya sp.]|nr:GTP-binding protein [Candidatus Melainabacteria bacterium]